LRTADQCAYILNQLDSEWVGLVLDTGHFHTNHPYKDIEEMVPYAVNWQIKEYTDGSKREVKMDYNKIIDLIISGGYKGFVPVESLKKKNEPYDPFERVEKMLVILNQEVKQFNSNLK
jgi:sugar phosphate isomerase/epimerase